MVSEVPCLIISVNPYMFYFMVPLLCMQVWFLSKVYIVAVLMGTRVAGPITHELLGARTPLIVLYLLQMSHYSLMATGNVIGGHSHVSWVAFSLSVWRCLYFKHNQCQWHQCVISTPNDNSGRFVSRWLLTNTCHGGLRVFQTIC